MRNAWTMAAACASLAMTATCALGGLRDGLEGAFFFNNDASDLSGWNRNGQVVGATFAKDRYGTENAAAFFDGVSSWIGTPVSGKQFPMSIAFWFSLETVPGVRPLAIVDSGVDSSYGHSYNIGVGPNRLNAHLAAPFGFKIGEWTHVAVCYNTNLQVFMNGQLVGERDYSEGPEFVAGNVLFGKHAGGDPRYFRGCIDDVLIYSRALASNEVAEIHRHGDRVEAGLRIAAASAEMFAQATNATASSAGEEGRSAGIKPVLILSSGGQEPLTNEWDMVDGRIDTRWEGDAGAPGWWIAMAFDPPVSLGGVALDLEADSATNAEYLVSMDAMEWSDYVPSTNTPPTDARFLWMLFRRGEDDPSLKIREIVIAPRDYD